jgi:hypothetical protein
VELDCFFEPSLILLLLLGYRCTYVNFPRARPIIKKPKSNINLYTGYTASTPSKNSEKAMLPNYHHANTNNYSSDEQVPLECQPEYRKARREFMLRERERTNNSLLDYLEKNAVTRQRTSVNPVRRKRVARRHPSASDPVVQYQGGRRL